MSRTFKPSLGRREAEGLMTKLIRRDQNNSHFYFVFDCLAMIFAEYAGPVPGKACN